MTCPQLNAGLHAPFTTLRRCTRVLLMLQVLIAFGMGCMPVTHVEAAPAVSVTFDEDASPVPPGDAIRIRNLSTNGERITRISLFLTTSNGNVLIDPLDPSFPVFPSVQGAADVGAYAVEFDDVGAVPLFFSEPVVFSDSYTGVPRTGYQMIEVWFTDFDPGELFQINLDADSEGGAQSRVDGIDWEGTLAFVTFSSSEPGLGHLRGEFLSTGESQATLNTRPFARARVLAGGENLGNVAEIPCNGPHGATVTLDGSDSWDPDGDDLEFEWSAAADSGASIAHPAHAVTEATFPVGVHEVTLTVYDLDANGERKGGVGVASVTIVVVDHEPPLARITTDLAALLPTNNKMVPVIVCVEASDACTDPADLGIVVEVVSSQPDDSDGTGELTGDVDGQDGFLNPVPVALDYLGDGLYAGLVYLRAERDGSDKAGRIYSLNLQVTDGAGNEGHASTTVVVPHNQGGKRK